MLERATLDIRPRNVFEERDASAAAARRLGVQRVERDRKTGSSRICRGPSGAHSRPDVGDDRQCRVAHCTRAARSPLLSSAARHPAFIRSAGLVKPPVDWRSCTGEFSPAGATTRAGGPADRPQAPPSSQLLSACGRPRVRQHVHSPGLRYRCLIGRGLGLARTPRGVLGAERPDGARQNRSATCGTVGRHSRANSAIGLIMSMDMFDHFPESRTACASLYRRRASSSRAFAFAAAHHRVRQRQPISATRLGGGIAGAHRRCGTTCPRRSSRRRRGSAIPTACQCASSCRSV
jgi:hypothetical protein